MEFTVKHSFNVDADTFWNEIFFSEAFNRQLYVDHLRFVRFEILEQKTEPGGRLKRRMQLEPRSEMPAAVKKIVGDSMSYIEEGEFSPANGHWSYSIIPSVKADKTQIKGELWLESAGPARVDRFCKLSIKVSVFGVGGIVEKFLENQTRQGLDQAALFTQQFIARRN